MGPRRPSRDSRRAGRVAAVQALYGIDAHDPPDWLEARSGIVDHLALVTPELNDEAGELARELLLGVIDGRAEIDELLRRAAANWRLERMSRVDRNVLRVAVYELTCRPDVPPAVVLDEAIEIAKQFGAAGSGAFVNGVLDRVLRELATS